MSTGHWVVAGISVAHRHASVEQLEAAAVDSQRRAVQDLLTGPGVEEAFVLQTCNRIEGYVVASDADLATAALADVFELDTESPDVGGPEPGARESAVVEASGADDSDLDGDAVVWMGHEESLRHLLRVAAGLESVVLGEDQILGQVRDAYQDARGVGGIGRILDEAVTKAMRVGERARTETAINEGALSLATAAVGLATDEADASGGTALVIGAGEMATLAAKSLAETVDRLLVANRTVPHAEHVVDTVADDAHDGEDSDAGHGAGDAHGPEASAIGLDALPTAIDAARIVVTATNSRSPVVPADAFADAGETFVVDIAQPRDVPTAVAERDAVSLYDLDALETVTEETREERRDAAVLVADIVDEEFDRLLTQYKRKRADRVISAMYESAERVKAQELETALVKADLDQESEAIVESMADAIVSQLLAAPTQSLRDAAEDDDWSTIHTALQLFDPDFGPQQVSDGPPSFVEGMAPEEIPEGMREQMPTAILEQLDD